MGRRDAGPTISQSRFRVEKTPGHGPDLVEEIDRSRRLLTIDYPHTLNDREVTITRSLHTRRWSSPLVTVADPCPCSLPLIAVPGL